MSHDPNDGAARARDLFARAAERTDFEAGARLREARRQALSPRIAPPAWRLAVPLGAAAALAVAFGVTRWTPATTPAPVPAEAAIAAIDPATPDEIERLLATDDADLYAWLGDAPVATAGAGR